MRKSLTYSSSKYNFSVDYPVNWDVREDLDGIVVVFAGPSVLEGIYDVNINVTAERLRKKMTLKDYVMEADLKAVKTIPDYKKEQADLTTIGGQPAIVLVATLAVKSKGEKVSLKNKYAIFIKDKVAYIITYDTPVECHDEYADCFDLVIGSFK
ncbi:MAG: hypothetical protein CL873_01875 [Dehalococcoidales bacterium]|nr:hypothetical protein [Dehalococcoidales bacterium]|tara:strand:- start:793 stop:1254 length:462 start_codon:yes stop_codon:yes gene_type:complete